MIKPTFTVLAVMFYLASARNIHNLMAEYKDSENNLGKEYEVRSSTRQLYPFTQYHNRRNYDIMDYYYKRQEELMLMIMDKLDEITFFISKSSSHVPPPHIVYMPVLHLEPQAHMANKSKNNNDDSFLNKHKGTHYDNDPVDFHNVNDGKRPIHLDPILTDEPIVKPPPVDHGTTQAGMTTVTSKSIGCNAAILFCCVNQHTLDTKECFSNYGCAHKYSISVCSNLSNAIINFKSTTVGPVAMSERMAYKNK